MLFLTAPVSERIVVSFSRRPRIIASCRPTCPYDRLVAPLSFTVIRPTYS